jgi:hypothetical protein
MNDSVTQNQGYAKFISRRRGVLKKADLDDVRNWVEKSIDELPEMVVTETALTGEGNWKEVRTEDGKEVALIEGDFFTLEGREVVVREHFGKRITEWVQPGLIQKQIPVSIPTPDGEITLLASDFVGIIRDRERNVLLTVGQGLFAKTEKHAKVKTPLQTSAVKAHGILEKGEVALDPTFSSVVKELGQGQSLFEMFATGEFEIFPLGEADENRIDATNIAFVTTVWDQKVRETLKEGGRNRWCAPDEVKALARAGLINGHTAAALLVV